MNFKPFFLAALALFCLKPLVSVSAEQTAGNATSNSANEEADKAWKELQKATRPPMPPAEWQGHPTPEQVQEFRERQAVTAEQASNKAKDFYSRYPDHPKAAEARKQEFEMLKVAVQLGSTNKTEALAALEAERLKDPKLSETERLQLRVEAVRRAIIAKRSEGQEAMLAVQEKGARDLIKEFPRRAEGYDLLLQVAGAASEDKAQAIAKEIAASQASEETKEGARGMLRKMEALGKPLPIQFAALDGREVDITKLSGKVVLVDFWATWCGPCVAEIPNVKKTYEALHPRGFEIVGISFDSEKPKLLEFIKKENMPWPQYFDGKGWGNKFGRQYGINGIPTMWLVDKKGNLRDMNARGSLEEKVERLLKE